jgi:transcriptional regulator GlxA family with amidase domain
MKIFVLALDATFDSGLSTVLDVFRTATDLAGLSGMVSPRFDVRLVGVRRRVVTAQGLSVPVQQVSNTNAPDCVVVPAVGFKTPETLTIGLTRPEIRDASDWLGHWAERSVTIAAACVGTFVLAESGVLDHHRATTTWWLASYFRRRYPRVALEESRMIVKSGNVLTAGAALGHVDLALSIVAQKSPKLASLTAKYLIADARPLQSVYVLSGHVIHSDPIVERFENWANTHLADGFSLDDAARCIGTSKRTLARRLETVLGKTPLSYFQNLRVEHAVHLLKTTDESVEAIASRVGYAEGVTLRTLLRRNLGKGVREIRMELRPGISKRSRVPRPDRRF